MTDMLADLLDGFTDGEVADLLRMHIRDKIVLSDAGMLVVDEVIRRMTGKDEGRGMTDEVPGPDSVDHMHLELLTAAVEIGSIVEMPHWMSAGISGRVMASGVSLDRMSVRGLMSLMKEQERMHAGLELAACGQEEL